MRDSSVTRWMGSHRDRDCGRVFLGFEPARQRHTGRERLRVPSWPLVQHARRAELGLYYLVGLALALLPASPPSCARCSARWERVSCGRTCRSPGHHPRLRHRRARRSKLRSSLAAHNHQYAIVKTFNFFSDNNELPIIFGMFLLSLTTGLGILLNRGATPLPKTLGWYSVAGGRPGGGGPARLYRLPVRLPDLALGHGVVIATKARRGTLGVSVGAVCASAATAPLVTT